MKKIFVYLASVCAVLGMASCSEDKDPVLQTPTTFVLNEPAMQDQYIQLNETDALELVCSQPDYGYSAVAQYSAQMSFDKEFSNPEAIKDLKAIDATQARFLVKQSDVAVAMNELLGIEDEESFLAKYPNGMTPEKIYFRAVCQLDGVEGSRIESNVVSYNNVVGYFAIPQPGFIYLVGNMTLANWLEPSPANEAALNNYRLYEPKDAIGSGVYSAVIDMPAAPCFRFYTALTGWDEDSYGYQSKDEATDFTEFTDGEFTSAVVKGKGAFNFPNFPAGKMTVTVDMSDMKNITLTCVAGESEVTVAKYIYLMGSAEGWSAPEVANQDSYNNWRLADKTGDGIYVGEFDIPAETWYCRLAYSLSESDGWDNPAQYGPNANDGDNLDASFSNGKFSGNYVAGKGSWVFTDFPGGKVSITVDTNSNSIEFVQE
jgi:hypothetical protein